MQVITGESFIEVAGIARIAKRIRISDDVKRDAEGAMKTAVDLLGMAADMTQNVPYLGIISGVLSELLKIFEEVEIFKADWDTTMHITKQIKAIIDYINAQYGDSSDDEFGGLPTALKEALNELEKSVVIALETLTRCRALSKSIRDRVRTVLNRNDLADAIKQCQTRMQAALSLFIAKLQVDSSIKIDSILNVLQHGQATSPSASLVEITISAFVPLPSPPPAFAGRAHEVDHTVDLILQHSPARVAILGSGGIGKTSIAVTVLHDPRIEERFGTQRFFVTCEAARTTDDVVRELSKLFRIDIDPTGKISPSDALLSHLAARDSGVLCLDNLETPWDNDIDAFDAWLGKLAHATRLAIIVTTRGTDLPMQVDWTQPRLPPITPLTFEASMQVWDKLCTTHDEYAEKLVRAVDYVPLAVTLLAGIAVSETPKLLWTRWNREQTELLRKRGPRNRLNNVETSIELSLSSPRLDDEPTAMQLLSVLCHLPQGLRDARITAFADAFESTIPRFYGAITLLKQCSLIYPTNSKDPSLRVLSPIRHYVCTRYPLPDMLFTDLAGIYRTLVDFQFDEFARRVSYMKKNLIPELGNIMAILTACLTRDPERLECTLRSIIAFARLSRSRYLFHSSFLSDAIKCSEQYPLMNAQLRDAQGHYLRFCGHYDDALVQHLSALDRYRAAQDRRGEGECLKYLGSTYRCLGRLAEAEQTLQSARQISADTGHYWAEAESLLCLSSIYIDTSRRWDEGKQLVKAALVMFDKARDRRGVASCVLRLGSLYSSQGQIRKAETLLSLAIALNSMDHNSYGQAESLFNFGMFYIKLGQRKMAEHLICVSQELHHKINSRLGETHCQMTLGSIYAQAGEPGKAERLLQSALDTFCELRDRRNQVTCLLNLGGLHTATHRFADAERVFKSAVELCALDDAQHRQDKAAIWLALASLRRIQNRSDEACALLRSSYAIFLGLSDIGGQATALHLLSSIYRDREEFDQAEKCLKDAYRLCLQSRPPERPEKQLEETIKGKLQLLREKRRSKDIPDPSLSPLANRDTTMLTINAAPSHRAILKSHLHKFVARSSDQARRRAHSFP